MQNRTLVYRDMTIKCYTDFDAWRHALLVMQELFDEGIYDIFPVEGRVVLDVGAYFGETAIYFSKKGAVKVIAVEPFLSCDYILENCSLNNVANVVPVKAAIGMADKVNPDAYAFWPNHSATRSKDVSPSHVRSLDSLIAEWKLTDAVLKMDCEGGEFNSIPYCKNLRAFQYIMLELHPNEGDCDALAQHISDRGYRVEKKPHARGTMMCYCERI